jgi:anti-sigma factor (TIGR02949 family)
MMDCKKALQLIHRYIDGELDAAQKEELEKHIESCESCRKEYQLEKNIIESLKNTPPLELPEDFNKKIHEKLVCQKNILEKKKERLKKTLTVAVIAASFILMTVFVVNIFKFDKSSRIESSAPLNNIKMTQSADLSKKEGINNEGNMFSITGQRGLPAGTSRKITKNATVSLEVEDVNVCYDKVFKLVKEAKGFIESSDETVFTDDTKRINLVLKVREDKFESVISQIKEFGKVTALRIDSKDVTDQYYDLKARLKNLEIEEQKLQDIMNKAPTVKEMLEVESEINRIRSEIESMKEQLKVWENLTSLGTINLSIKEVSRIEKSSTLGSFREIGREAKQAFVNNVNFLIFFIKKLIIILVIILPYIVLVLIGYKVYIYIKKRR